MEAITIDVTLFATATAPPQPLGLSLVQGDLRAVRLRLRVYEGAREFDYLSVTDAKPVFIKADGTRVRGVAELTEEGILYDIGSNELETPGRVMGALQLWEGDVKRLTTSMFTFSVTADPLSPSAVESSTYLGDLEELMAQARAAMEIVDGWIEDPEQLRGPEGKAATITVGATTTGTPGAPAQVTNSGTDSAAVLDFVVPAGETGAGLQILGQYTTPADLRAAHPTGEPGDAYAVGDAPDTEIYIWDGAQGAWVDIGKMTATDVTVNGIPPDSTGEITVNGPNIPYTGTEIPDAEHIQAGVDAAYRLAGDAIPAAEKGQPGGVVGISSDYNNPGLIRPGTGRIYGNFTTPRYFKVCTMAVPASTTGSRMVLKGIFRGFRKQDAMSGHVEIGTRSGPYANAILRGTGGFLPTSGIDTMDIMAYANPNGTVTWYLYLSGWTLTDLDYDKAAWVTTIHNELLDPGVIPEGTLVYRMSEHNFLQVNDTAIQYGGKDLATKDDITNLQQQLTAIQAQLTQGG